MKQFIMDLDKDMISIEIVAGERDDIQITIKEHYHPGDVMHIHTDVKTLKKLGRLIGEIDDRDV